MTAKEIEGLMCSGTVCICIVIWVIAWAIDSLRQK